MANEYLRPKEVAKMLKIAPNTLRSWEKDGKISSIRTEGGHRRYRKEDFNHLLKKQEIARKCICYARVSSRGQRADLERQIDFFRREYPDHEIVQDIGSGLNSKRKGFKTILECAIRGELEELVVTHRDRLSRFGFDLVEWIIHQFSHGEVVVLNNAELSPERELSEDLLSIIALFSGRLYGLRSHSIARKVQEAVENPQNQNISDE